MAGRADGVPIELELELAGADCSVLPGRAIYLWQNDAAGIYSLYAIPRSTGWEIVVNSSVNRWGIPINPAVREANCRAAVARAAG